MTSWDAAIAHILWWETGGDLINGAPHNDPEDPGGFTKWGVSQRAWPNISVKDLTRPQAEALYYERYWLDPKINLLPPVVGIQVIDFGVTSGPDRAIRILQRTLKLKADGKIGNQTITACSDSEAARKLLIARLYFYRRLNKSKYEDGWENRTASCALVAGRFAQ